MVCKSVSCLKRTLRKTVEWDFGNPGLRILPDPVNDVPLNLVLRKVGQTDGLDKFHEPVATFAVGVLEKTTVRAVGVPHLTDWARSCLLRTTATS